MKLGRILENHRYASEFARENPHIVLTIVNAADKELRWTKVSEFFSLFPPIKRYEDDGTWCYNSTKKMIREDFRETFGKGDIKMLLMTRCYENKFFHLVGFAYMCATSELSKRKTGESLVTRMIREGVPHP
ncbi:hypothetical protein ACFSR7_36315 [Cohnella sp. GCM10020058]|uniref:hypothetical protein n=1 Tax=Cohnella sp. GCM10020058 TaxID=3317330 RepID=UPI00362606DD